jgi:hypothetical protein
LGRASFGTNASWHFTTDRLWLDIVPGALAILGGLALLVSATRIRGAMGGWLATIGGAWFAIGPAVAATWQHGGGPIGPPLGTTTRQAFELIGYFYGLGALIIALAAFAAGRFASRPRLAADAGTATAVAAAEKPARPSAARARGWPLPRRGDSAAPTERAAPPRSGQTA